MGTELPRPGSFTTAALHKPALEENIPAPRTVEQVQEAQSAQAASTTKFEEKKRRGRTFGEANGLGPKVTSSLGVGPTLSTVLAATTYCSLPTVVICEMKPQLDKKLTAVTMAVSTQLLYAFGRSRFLEVAYLRSQPGAPLTA